MEANQQSYKSYTRRKWLVLAVTLILLAGSVLLSLSAGSAGLSWKDIIKALLGLGDGESVTIVRNVRLPRAMTALVVGMGLAISGCVMQNVLRNPMASASTLGVSQGAGFGAAAAIAFVEGGAAMGAAGMTQPTIITLFAFLGGMATTLVILALSKIGRSGPATMVLAGVALSSVFTGLTTLIQYFVDDVKLASMLYWTFGSLSRASWSENGMIALVGGGAFLYFYCHRLHFNAMEAGTATARSLGVPVDRLVFVSMTVCALVSSVCVAFTGSIAFVGLIAPHIMRKLLGSDHRFLLPGAALGGGILLLLAEVTSRVMLPPAVLPIGALTSFLGAPMFLYLCIKGGKRNG